MSISDFCTDCILEAYEKCAVPACLDYESKEWIHEIQFCDERTLNRKRRNKKHKANVNSVILFCWNFHSRVVT